MKSALLGEIAQLGSGGTPRRSVAEYFGPGTPWMSIADLNDGIVHEAKESLTDSGLANSSAKVVPPGTILLAMYGSIGKLAIAGISLCTSQAIAFIRPDPKKVDREYLFHYLRAQRPQLQAKGRGGTQMNISQGDLKKWVVPLPPLDEQHRIAAILDQADGIRHKRRETRARLEDLAESLFLDLFDEDAADAVSFDSVVTSFRNGLSPAKAGTVMSDVLTLSAVTQGIFDPTAVKTSTFMAKPPAAMRVSGDDFLICRGNGNLNLVGVGVSPGHDYPDLTFPDTVIAASFDAARVDPVYLEMAWKRPAVRRQVESVARTTNGTYKINQQSLGAVGIVIPPLSEQQEFTRRIRAIPNPDSAEMDELLQSLESRAFSGQL